MGYNEKDTPSKWRYLKPGLIGTAMALIFGLTASELGIVSSILHHYGNDVANYPNQEFKHDLGILLFSCIVTLLFVLSHPWSNTFMAAVCSFVLAVFWGTGAGVVFHTTPFEAYTCNRPLDSFPPQWRPFHNRCQSIVAMQGIAWALWGIFLFMLIGMLSWQFQCSRRKNIKGFYEV